MHCGVIDDGKGSAGRLPGLLAKSWHGIAHTPALSLYRYEQCDSDQVHNVSRREWVYRDIGETGVKKHLLF